MQKNSNRRGLALGAIFALVASFFVSAPAQAATDGADIGIYPAVESGATSSYYVGVLGEDFPLVVQGKGSFALASGTNLTYKIEKTAGTGMDVIVSSSAAAQDVSSATSASPGTGRVAIHAGTASATISAFVNGSGVSHLNFVATSVSAAASWSAVTLKITVWRDNQGGVANDVVNSDEPFTTQTVTLLHPKDLSRTITITDMVSGSNRITASATVTGVNLGNLGRSFQLVSSISGTVVTSVPADFGTAVDAPVAAVRGGVVSHSGTVTLVGATTLYGAGVVSVGLYYGGIQVGATASSTVGAAKATALVVEAVESDDVAGRAANVTSSAQTFDVRPNKSYTVKVTALNNTLSAAALPLEVSMTGPSITAATGSLSVDGGAATTSYPTKLALTTAADGTASFKFSTTGFAASGQFVVTVKSAQLSQTATLVIAPAAFKVVNDRDLYSTTPGTAVKLNFDVEDQWGVASDRTNQRIQVTRGGSGFAYAETISFVAVTAGKASFDFTPSPATKTGSAEVTTVLQQFDADANTWVAVADSAGKKITVNVTADANAFTGSALASVSASISYAIASGKYSWSGVLTLKVVNPGSAVKVDLAGGIIEDNETGKTYSATVTLTSSTSGTLKLRFASAKAGKQTVTYTNGTATTTSEFVVAAPDVKNAKTITFGSETLTAGTTTTITGTLTDALGNGIETSALGIKYTGKGLPFNIGSAVATDENGKFSFQVLVLAGETGAGTATATFKPTGVAADDISVSKTFTIATPAAPAAPEVNAVIGTFNSRVAVRVENAKGAAVSVKVGARWFKYTSLNDNYLWSIRSAKGRTVAVAVYVNGTLENVATITVK